MGALSKKMLLYIHTLENLLSFIIINTTLVKSCAFLMSGKR